MLSFLCDVDDLSISSLLWMQTLDLFIFYEYVSQFTGMNVDSTSTAECVLANKDSIMQRM